LYLLWVCQPPLLQVLLVWSPPKKTPVRAFLMKVRNLTISYSRPIGAAHRGVATPPPPPEGREIPPWKKEEEL